MKHFQQSKIKRDNYVYLRIYNFIVEIVCVMLVFRSIPTDNEDTKNKKPDVAKHESRVVFFFSFFFVFIATIWNFYVLDYAGQLASAWMELEAMQMNYRICRYYLR